MEEEPKKKYWQYTIIISVLLILFSGLYWNYVNSEEEFNKKQQEEIRKKAKQEVEAQEKLKAYKKEEDNKKEQARKNEEQRIKDKEISDKNFKEYQEKIKIESTSSKQKSFFNTKPIPFFTSDIKGDYYYDAKNVKYYANNSIISVTIIWDYYRQYYWYSDICNDVVMGMMFEIEINSNNKTFTELQKLWYSRTGGCDSFSSDELVNNSNFKDNSIVGILYKILKK